VEEFEVESRDTKLGPEEITRDIPNVGEEALKDLDDSGIIRIGAEVKAGDILVGKVTPKGETMLTPEEKLLRAIFGEKAEEVKESCLYVPPGIEGTIVDVRVLSRKGIEKDQRTKSIEEDDIGRLQRDLEEEIRIVREERAARIRKVLSGHKLADDLKDSKTKEVICLKGKRVNEAQLARVKDDLLLKIKIDDPEVKQRIDGVSFEVSQNIRYLEARYQERIERVRKGDELPPGVNKVVKVFIAMKRKIQVGDKMAGRHGNKGVVSMILPEEDMPYLSDGRPVDIVLNPLGVPSRMNVGQILEAHLGWAAYEIGRKLEEMCAQTAASPEVRKFLKDLWEKDRKDKESTRFLDDLSDDDVQEFVEARVQGVPVSTPVFEGAKEAEIKSLLKRAGLPVSGQQTLFDGRTGEPFKRPVTVGGMYMLKLHHLVADKIHARSIGPYSLVTQQPLGGKAQFGGQRLGEMEVWALEAYGAAHTLQEFLTVKSDDISGRSHMYEAVVKGDPILEPGVPESFHVLIKELQSLCLDVELLEKKRKTEE
jgi:DNA-directed RNA polymerase subunit beta